LFGWLDHRSEYGQGIYPEPFLVDDSDLETNEARLDWLHTHRNDQHSDLVTAEVEKGFRLLTLEVEIPYERDVEAQNVTDGVGNIDLGARYPIYQYVSSNGWNVKSGVRSNPRASAREDLRRNFCAAANFKYQRGYRSRNSGVRSCRSCRIREQGLYPKIQDQHLPGKIFAKLPDSLAPELLQLLTPEFRNALGGKAQVSEKRRLARKAVNDDFQRLDRRGYN
jgi:hypothetical protein